MAKRKQPQPSSEPEHEVTWTAIPRFPSSSEKHAYLLALAGPQFGEMFALAPGRDLVLGRKDDVDVQLRDDGVSRRHATLRVEGEGALLVDLGSANGTYVDGKRVPEARVTDGSRIQIGAHTALKFIWADEVEAFYQVRLAEGAFQDALTGLYNRRHLDERLTSELAAAQRHGRALSLLLVDIDHFKQVNDAHGHLAGDEALKMVAFVLRGAVRKEDVLARFGGEEFCVIARETPLDGALALAERIRLAVERSQFTWEGRQLGVTVSVGLTVSVGAATFVPGRSERDLLGAADRALYAAKQQGRNRVVAVEPEPTREAS
ncbi:MAG TPA: GGDEF domain-containing protein [Anaeromyxobacter sp.]